MGCQLLGLTGTAGQEEVHLKTTNACDETHCQALFDIDPTYISQPSVLYAIQPVWL